MHQVFIVANAILLGIEIDVSSRLPQNEVPEAFGGSDIITPGVTLHNSGPVEVTVSRTHAPAGSFALQRKWWPRVHLTWLFEGQVGSRLRTLCFSGGISARHFGSHPHILGSRPRILRYCLLGTQLGTDCGAGAGWFREVSWGSSAHSLCRFLVQRLPSHPTPPPPSSAVVARVQLSQKKCAQLRPKPFWATHKVVINYDPMW